jgi:hypothetical protein
MRQAKGEGDDESTSEHKFMLFLHLSSGSSVASLPFMTTNDGATKAYFSYEGAA